VDTKADEQGNGCEKEGDAGRPELPDAATDAFEPPFDLWIGHMRMLIAQPFVRQLELMNG
jgi:hypothetical protein